MTVLMRDEVNDTDLAWAAADPALAGVAGQMLQARRSLAAAEAATGPGVHAESGPLLPSFLRERGAL